MRTICLMSFSTFLLIFVAPAFGQRVGETVTISEPLLTDQYVAGRIILVNAPIEGDLVVGGQDLIVNAGISGDVIAAGESLELRGAVGDDVRAAGRTVTITGPVSGHVVAAGAEVSLSPESSVADWAWVAGTNLTIEGRIGGELRAAGESVTLTGRVDGDANLMGQRIQIGSGAIIGGDLIVQSETEPEIADGATVRGEIVREDLPEGMDRFGPLRWLSGIAGFVYFAVTLITAVLAMAFLFPGFSRATSDRVVAMPVRSLGAGLLAAVGIPILTVLVFMTGIGLIVGFALLGAYFVMLLLATLLGIIAVGQLGLKLVSTDRASRTSGRILALATATVVVLLILRIPVLGGLLMLVLILAGLGAFAGELWGRYRRTA